MSITRTREEAELESAKRDAIYALDAIVGYYSSLVDELVRARTRVIECMQEERGPSRFYTPVDAMATFLNTLRSVDMNVRTDLVLQRAARLAVAEDRVAYWSEKEGDK